MRIIHSEGWTGWFEPADAHPPFTVRFVDGVAEVPMGLFESDQFQVYCQREEAEGVWTVEYPEPVAPRPVVVPEPKPVVRVPSKPKPVAKKAATPRGAASPRS